MKQEDALHAANLQAAKEAAVAREMDSDLGDVCDNPIDNLRISMDISVGDMGQYT